MEKNMITAVDSFEDDYCSFDLDEYMYDYFYDESCHSKMCPSCAHWNGDMCVDEDITYYDEQ